MEQASTAEERQQDEGGGMMIAVELSFVFICSSMKKYFNTLLKNWITILEKKINLTN